MKTESEVKPIESRDIMKHLYFTEAQTRSDKARLNAISNCNNNKPEDKILFENSIERKIFEAYEESKRERNYCFN